MKVLVFAHVPPPHHGQSYMVQQMLDNLKKPNFNDVENLVFFHVNVQLSDNSGDIGVWRTGKFLRLIKYIMQAWYMRWKYAIEAFYYVPAPPKRNALYRDWLVLASIGSFFKIRIFHWHAVGLGTWIKQRALSGWHGRLKAWITKKLFSRHDLSICLSNYSKDEIACFSPRKIVIVPNGIPDPCPNFDVDIGPERQLRAKVLGAAWSQETKECLYYEVLFLSGCMTQKGLFEAMAAVTRANHLLEERKMTLRMRFTIAGTFAGMAERSRFEAAAQKLNATRFQTDDEPLARYVGWADEERKNQLYRNADCFIFPTTYPVESFGLVLAEAMAFGCSIITTRWQAIPEVLPKNYPNLVEPHDVEAMAQALLRCARNPDYIFLREYFLSCFTSDHFIRNIKEAFNQLQSP